MIKVNKDGYTLVEVILALAILGILAAAFLPAFQSSFLWIVNAGDRSVEIHEAQELSESFIQQNIPIDENNPEEISFVFTDPDNGTTIPVILEGSYVVFEPIEFFLPETGNVQ